MDQKSNLMSGCEPIPTEGTVPGDCVATRSAAWLSALAILLCLRFLIAESYGGLINSTPPIRAGDFDRFFYPAAVRADQGASLYRDAQQTSGFTGYVYSPLLAVVMKPLAKLPYETALRVWFAANAMTLVLAVAFFAAALRLSWRMPVGLLVVLISGFRFWPSTSSFIIGQVNHPLLMLICAGLWAGSRGRWKWAGACIGVAGLVKVWLLGLLLFFVMRRAWRGLAGAGLAFGLGIVGSFTVVGWHQFGDYLAATAAASSQPFLVSHSFSGFARLHFSVNGIVHPLVDSTLLRWSIVIGGDLIIALSGILVAWRSPLRTTADDCRRMAFCALCLLLALPLCHAEYAIFALPAIWTLLLVRRGSGEGKAAAVQALCGLAAYLMMTKGQPFYFVQTMHFTPGWQTLRVSLCFFAILLLWVTLLIDLLSVGRRPANDPSRARKSTVALPIEVGN